MYTPIRDFYLVSPQNRKSSANTNTIKMDEEDAERDRLLSVMFYMVSNGLKASKAAVKAAAQQLDVVLRPYKGAQGAADDAETSLIKGLILDLRKEENTAAVTTLGLDATVDELEEANNNFDAAKNKRTRERALTEGDNLKDARSKTDTVYQNMCTLISAAALVCRFGHQRDEPRDCQSQDKLHPEPGAKEGQQAGRRRNR